VSVTLRDYQQELDGNVAAAWAGGARVVIMRLDTGGGKTRIIAAMIERNVGASCVIAHRDTIVSQLSMALAECGTRHQVIASDKTRRKIAARQVKQFGRSFLDPNAPCVVASVATLVRRKGLEAWAAQVTLWVVDEGHHVVLDNMWHTAIAKFTHPQVRGLLPTATPERPDGKGLGTPTLGGDGVADAMVDGPPMRWLIEEGYLCDYRVVCADSHVTELLGAVGASGDWSTAQLKAAEGQTPIVGDAVATFRNLNMGVIGGIPARAMPRRAVLFASNVTTAGDMLKAMRMAGYVAELITGETDEDHRWRVFDRLEAGEVHVVIAVDVISEGTDFPALEVAILARASASIIVVRQQIGRVLRPFMTPAYRAARNREERLAAIAASPKPLAYIVDHVGNFTRHGPPDRPRQWSLVSTRGSRGKSDAIAYRACLNAPDCAQPFERFRTHCPWCGWEVPPPADRSTPAMVAGDMVMMDPAMLDALRGKVQEAFACEEVAAKELQALQHTKAQGLPSLDDYRARLAATGLPQGYILRNAKSHAAKMETFDADMDAKIAKQAGVHQAHQTRNAVLEVLRQAMATWGGYRKAEGLTDREMQKLFLERFGVDVLTPMTYDAREAAALIEKILFDGAVI